MSESSTISRRNFLVAGVVVGSMGLVSQESVSAVEDSITRLADAKTFGGIEYIQLHCSETFSLARALRTLESVTKGYSLEKVSAAGEKEFDLEPKQFIATFYYKEGFRATISSGPSPHPSVGTVRGEEGDIIVSGVRLEVLDKKGKLQTSLSFTQDGANAAPPTLAYIVQSLREGVTVFPETAGQ